MRATACRRDLRSNLRSRLARDQTLAALSAFLRAVLSRSASCLILISLSAAPARARLLSGFFALATYLNFFVFWCALSRRSSDRRSGMPCPRLRRHFSLLVLSCPSYHLLHVHFVLVGGRSDQRLCLVGFSSDLLAYGLVFLLVNFKLTGQASIWRQSSEPTTWNRNRNQPGTSLTGPSSSDLPFLACSDLLAAAFSDVNLNWRTLTFGFFSSLIVTAGSSTRHAFSLS